MEAAGLNPYETKVLDPDVHERLVANIDFYASEAGIPKRMLWTPIADVCNEAEIDWLRRFRHLQAKGVAGLVLTGHLEPPPEVRMMAMVGALVRNFINARVMTAQELFRASQSGDVPEHTAIAVPNFFVSDGENSDMPSWMVAELYSALVDRFKGGRMTILYVSGLERLRKKWGPTLADHIEQNYTILP